MNVSIPEKAVFTALRTFLVSVLPPSVEVIRAQVNRVASPKGPFVTMTPLSRRRLATNVDEFNDASLVGSIAGTVLTVTAVSFGIVRVGAPVYGDGVLEGTTVVASNPDGTFTVSQAQTVASRPLFAGVGEYMQSTEITVQLDVYGAGSSDNTQIISTLFRDEYACASFSASGYDVQPLYTSEPRQMPFITGENQYEDRWSIDVVLQANPVVTAPQQFAGALSVVLVPVP